MRRISAEADHSFESSDRRIQQGILSKERVWQNLEDSQLRKEVFLRNLQSEAYRAEESSQKVPADRGPMLSKRPDSEERIGEVSGSRRVFCCRGLVHLVSEELMEKRMTTNSHSRDCRGSERGHNRK